MQEGRDVSAASRPTAIGAPSGYAASSRPSSLVAPLHSTNDSAPAIPARNSTPQAIVGEAFEAILRQRSKEKALRKANAARLNRFTAVAKEAYRSSTAGATDAMLQQRLQKFQQQLPSRPSTETGGGAVHRGGGFGRRGSSDDDDDDDESSLRPQHGVHRLLQQPLSAPPSAGRGSSETGTTMTIMGCHEPSMSAPSSSRQTHTTSSCASQGTTITTSVSIRRDGDDVSEPRSGATSAGSGRGSDAIVGTIPLSLRRLVAQRQEQQRVQEGQHPTHTPSPPPPAVATDATPPVEVAVDSRHNSVSGSGAPTTSSPAPSTLTPPTESNPPAATSSSAPIPQRSRSRPHLASATTAPKSILKRHPIPRKHKRHVHFSDENLQATSVSLGESISGTLRLSKDGPPVDSEDAFVQELSAVLSSHAATSVAGPSESDANGVRSLPSVGRSSAASSLQPCGANWDDGASDFFAKEWGLPSPHAAHEEPSRKQRSSRNSNAAGLSRASFHTGLSVEELRLMQAIVEVNQRLKRTGFRSTVTSNAPPSSVQQQRTLVEPPAVAVVADGSVNSTSPRTSEVCGRMDADVSSFPREVVERRVIFGPNMLRQQDLATNASSAAQTSRNAPVPTASSTALRVVQAPAMEAPTHVAVALPKRKSDHHALTRRDRFGKKMSVIPQ